MVGHMYKDVDQVNEVTMNSSCHALWVQILPTLLTAFPKKILYICKIAKQDIEIVLENRSGFPTLGPLT